MSWEWARLSKAVSGAWSPVITGVPEAGQDGQRASGEGQKVRGSELGAPQGVGANRPVPQVVVPHTTY